MTHIYFQKTFVRVKIKDPKEHIQRTWNGNLFYESNRNGMLHEVLKREKKGGKYIDIGACIGNHTLFFAKVMEGTVYAFEPHKPNREHLMENFELNPEIQSKVWVFNCALGASRSTCNTVSMASNNAGMVKVEPGTEVMVEPLDFFRKEVTGFDCMKIDVEGNNVEVLTGAARTLTEGQGNVYIECETPELLKATDDLMQQYGYERVKNLIMNHTPTYLWVKA